MAKVANNVIMRGMSGSIGNLIFRQMKEKLYIQALYEHRNQNRPFHRVHMAIGKRLKKRVDLVKQLPDRSSKNIFGLKNNNAVWRKVK